MSRPRKPAANRPAAIHVALGKLRAAAGLSVRQVTAKTGIDHSTVQRMETGAIKHPTFTNVCKLARLYSVPLTDLEY